LSSTENTPRELTWNMVYFDGQRVTLKVPTIRLSDLSIKEIGERNLLPIGQFYLRTFETLTKDKVGSFLAATKELQSVLRGAVERGDVPYDIALGMQDTIRETIDNAISRSGEEVRATMTEELLETMPWIDYRAVFKEIEERSEARGEARGEKTGTEKGIRQNSLLTATNYLKTLGRGKSVAIQDIEMQSLGVPDDIIKAVRNELARSADSGHYENKA
jgi:hypothetical protein